MVVRARNAERSLELLLRRVGCYVEVIFLSSIKAYPPPPIPRLLKSMNERPTKPPVLKDPLNHIDLHPKP